ncbi:hypothetical protein A7982_12308 [Minicystis rosea]|nr:hypothetical protein A7982_12308 [Minicystis rosea]
MPDDITRAAARRATRCSSRHRVLPMNGDIVRAESNALLITTSRAANERRYRGR